MAEFKAIMTQEEFDAAIQSRLERERNSIEKKYSDYKDLKTKAAEAESVKAKEAEYVSRLEEAGTKLTDLETRYNEASEKLAQRDQAVTDLTTRAVKAETSLLKARIAHEFNIPHEMADRLAGDTEADIRKDAETLAKFVAPSIATPVASNEPTSTADPTLAAYAALLQGLNNG